jgi:hypothetical protein
MVDDAGAVADVGEALMAAVTAAGALTTRVADWVTGPPLPCAVIVKV